MSSKIKIKAPKRIVLEFVEALSQATPNGFVSLSASIHNLYESPEAYFATKQAVKDEREAAATAARSEAIARERAREAAGPQPVAPVVPGEENCFLRREPMAAETIAEQDGGEWMELVSDKHFALSTREFFDALGHSNETLVTITPGGTLRYADAAGLLDTAKTIEPNPRELGVSPKRRWLISEFNGIERGCKLVSHLRGNAHLTAIVACGGRDVVQAWFDVSKLTQTRLAKFYAETVRLGSPNTTGRADFQAVMPCAKMDGAGNPYVARAMQAAGIDSPGVVPGKNVVLFFDPPNK